MQIAQGRGPTAAPGAWAWCITSVLMAAVIVACQSLPANTIIDGWSVGADRNCRDVPHCDALIPAAIEGFDQFYPGHPPVVSLTLHNEGLYPYPNGALGRIFRSGGFPTVALFHLADGSIRAIAVGYPGISRTPMAFDHGPERGSS